jgi:serine/threonine-protein kinase
VLFLAILAGGVGARALLEPGTPQAKPAASAPAPAAAGGFAEVPAKAEAPLGKKLARLERQPAPFGGVNARVELAVAPWGEVLVDGHSRGVSPPLRMVELAPGAHTVEIRNSTFPAHVEQVQLKAGEAVRIRHRFR